MSKLYKAKKAVQARKRRARQRNHFDVLRQLAGAPNATSSEQIEYQLAVERRTKYLKRARETSESQRKKLKTDIEKGVASALVKARRHKEAKKTSDLRRRNEGRISTLKAQQRAAVKVKFIKDNLRKQKSINGQWVPWRKGQWTPLGVAIKLGDLHAVRWLLENDASPSKRCTRTLNLRPLYLAAEDNRPEIVKILLESLDLREDGKSYGALHWAVNNKMFKVVGSFIDKGYDINEYYLDQTPLGASVTCGKTSSGDARLVKRLLDASADVLKSTKLCSWTYARGELRDLVTVAKAYSNRRCIARVEAAYHAAKNQ